MGAGGGGGGGGGDQPRERTRGAAAARAANGSKAPLAAAASAAAGESAAAAPGGDDGGAQLGAGQRRRGAAPGRAARRAPPTRHAKGAIGDASAVGVAAAPAAVSPPRTPANGYCSSDEEGSGGGSGSGGSGAEPMTMERYAALLAERASETGGADVLGSPRRERPQYKSDAWPVTLETPATFPSANLGVPAAVKAEEYRAARFVLRQVEVERRERCDPSSRPRRWQDRPVEVDVAAAAPAGNGTLRLMPGLELPIPPFYDELVTARPRLRLPALEDVAASARVLSGRVSTRRLRELQADGGAAYSHALEMPLRMTLDQQLIQQLDPMDPTVRASEVHKARQAAMDAAPVLQGRANVRAHAAARQEAALQRELERARASELKQELRLADKEARQMILEERRLEAMLAAEERKLQAEERKLAAQLAAEERKLARLAALEAKQVGVELAPGEAPLSAEELAERRAALGRKRQWSLLVRRDVPRAARQLGMHSRRRNLEAAKVAAACAQRVRDSMKRNAMYASKAGSRCRRLMRDAIALQRKVAKEKAEAARQREREEQEQRLIEEEMREAKRQQQRLNFLLTQTELYSHFMKGSGANVAQAGAKVGDGSTATDGSDGDVADDDVGGAEALAEAQAKARAAADEARERTAQYDAEAGKLRGERDRGSNGKRPRDGTVVADASRQGLQEAQPTPLDVKQPASFGATLKEYQLKGLRWLANSYEQGINGILADEMGLGKTVQALAFLLHLAEAKGIWGPFLIVSPTSTLPNWADEVSRFTPFRALPYWGSQGDRQILRRSLDNKKLFKRDSDFHVVITSYDLVVRDEPSFKRVKWQYMVLDEAQAIKSSSSARWQTLLSFKCRNRLLLTGTPIQNNMAELWALLHFIMPTLFDSHEQFQEWFSGGIEGAAQGSAELNEHQLRRLHQIISPFMLRRIKLDVVSEMAKKTEVMVPCHLTSKQSLMYNKVRNKISLKEILGQGEGGGSFNEKKALNLMNVVMQLRKVCNHPELFERCEEVSALHFGERPPEYPPAPFGEMDAVAAGGCRPLVSQSVPKLLWRELLEDNAWGRGETDRAAFSLLGARSRVALTIFDAEHIHATVRQGGVGSAFSAALGEGLSPGEVAQLATGCDAVTRWMYAAAVQRPQRATACAARLLDCDVGHGGSLLRSLSLSLAAPAPEERVPLLLEAGAEGPDGTFLPPLVMSREDRLHAMAGTVRRTFDLIPRAAAPPPALVCSDRSFAHATAARSHHPWTLRALAGWGARAAAAGTPSPPPPQLPARLASAIDAGGALGIEPAGCGDSAGLASSLWSRVRGPSMPVKLLNAAALLAESAKLQALDVLMRRLFFSEEGHRVLIFAQMTKMIDILEDYMTFRGYTYMRLDGSNSVSERREMVARFQRSNEVFCFILSTRAGGLGINLTAADTVIFYESDWNPTMDLQAMDRAHRLGQTREVTVYRLICGNTVEEKILRRAEQKKTVQKLVMQEGGAMGAADNLEAEEVVGLLLDDAELEASLAVIKNSRAGKRRSRGKFLGQRGATDVGASAGKPPLPPAGKKRGRPKGSAKVATAAGGAPAAGRGRPPKVAKADPRGDAAAAASAAAAAPPVDVHACCDKCDRWRMLPAGTVIDSDKPWYCSMSPVPAMAAVGCDAPEVEGVIDTVSVDMAALGPSSGPEQAAGGAAHPANASAADAPAVPRAARSAPTARRRVSARAPPPPADDDSDDDEYDEAMGGDTSSESDGDSDADFEAR